MADTDAPPILSAVSSSARQLYLLLRCINLSSKAQVQISSHGLRFSVEDSAVLEGMAFLEKSLFTSYHYNPPPEDSARPSQASQNDSPENEEDEEDGEVTPTFSISLPSLLETLQIFGLTEPTKSSNPYYSRDPYTRNAFSHQVLGISSLCRLTYHSPGSPLTIILTESGITTTCDLVTYEPSYTTDIPFDRQNIIMKIIMRGAHLHDAISELGTAAPKRLTISANAKTFTLAAASDLGSALVEFHRDAGAHCTPATVDGEGSVAPNSTGVLETFQVAPGTFTQSYKFDHIAKAKKAMAAAAKVSIRADEQGVMSLQFMVENLEANSSGPPGSGSVSFVDFRFVPLLREEGDPEDVDVGGGESTGEDD